MFANYFSPLDEDFKSFLDNLSKNQIGRNVICNINQSFPDIDSIDFAIIFAPEYRGGSLVKTQEADLINIRKELYSLYRGDWNYRIGDFGNLIIGNNVKDSYFAINDIFSNLISQSVFPILIGGSNDLVYAIYRSYESFLKGVNLLCVDSKFDLLDSNPKTISSNNFIGHIIKEEPNHLSNYINLAYQSYFCQNDESRLLDKMNFDYLRLGDLRQNITSVEPHLRSSDIVSFDLSSIKQSDAPGTTSPSPNGLEAHHSCAITRYAGMSDRVSSLGIFEIDLKNDVSKQTIKLVSQIIWYFFEGFSLRNNDFPNSKNIDKNFQKFIIPVPDSNNEFVFYKSLSSSRWWVSCNLEHESIEVQDIKIIPCSYEDYLDTISGDIPKRIFKILSS